MAPLHTARLSFFFQAEDGIRDVAVTGVQTCALPISMLPRRLCRGVGRQYVPTAHMCHLVTGGIERATRPRDMRQINRVSGVGHIQNGSPVSLAGESQPVNGRASMVSHVRDVAIALANDERLIGRASVQ